MTHPKDEDPASTWAWYVAAGATAAERRDRLRETPERVRPEVEARVRRMWRHKPKPGAAR